MDGLHGAGCRGVRGLLVEPVAVSSRFRLNVAVSWLAHLIEALVAMVLMPYCIRVLGDAAYGYWLFLTALVSHLGLVTFGLGGTVSRYVSDAYHRGDRGELSRVISAACSIYTLLGALSLLVGGGAAACIAADAGGGALRAHELQWVVLLLGVKTAADFVAIPFGGTLFGVRRIHLEQSIEIVASLTRAGLVLWLVRDEWGLLWLASGMAIVSTGRLLVTMAVALFCVRPLEIRLFRGVGPTVRTLYGFSRFVFLDSISSTIFQATDNLLIGWMLNPAAIVPYQIASRISKLVEVPLTRVAHVLMPEASRLHVSGAPRDLQRLVLKVARFTFLLIGGFFVGAGFFGDNLIRTWVGQGYTDSHAVLMILTAQLLVGLPATAIREVMLGCGSVRASSTTNLLMAALNLGISVALIPHYGVYGAAAGTLIARLLVDPAFMITMLATKLDIRPRDALLGIFARPLLPIGVMAVCCSSLDRCIPGIEGWPLLIVVTVGGVSVLLAAYGLFDRLLPDVEDAVAAPPPAVTAGA